MIKTPDGNRVINISNAQADYMLAVGETAVIEYVDKSSIPLHIATSTAGIYRLGLFNNRLTFRPTIGYIALKPNNTTYSGEISRISIETRGDFYMGSTCSLNCEAIISTRTESKSIMSQGIFTQSDSFYNETNNSVWNNSTTEWKSLGTLFFPQLFSGFIVVERIA